ncbi:hypothetical protein K788_0008505 [Paraburkholderia caribensis MBA4]|uniref:Uncharacterized protein n=1 Tax=Paraburkholderia caribensis MBA4 TaxID=1323664 RepID=A0A0P0REJ1_9BURK|nr:hypothetical protein K788_0008505 [Paraburkholderia caribensis MBA4]
MRSSQRIRLARDFFHCGAPHGAAPPAAYSPRLPVAVTRAGSRITGLCI